MTPRRCFLVATTLVPLLAAGAVAQAPIGSAFSDQGRLRSSSMQASGPHDFEFRLFDAATLGNQVGPTVCLDGVDVVEGLFTVPLDFGGQFMTNGRWLEIAVRADAVPDNCGSGASTTLAPRQMLTATPFALALPGLWTESNAISPNIIAGDQGNNVAYGRTITGWGVNPSGNYEAWVAVIPEPGTLALAAFGALMCIRRRSR